MYKKDLHIKNPTDEDIDNYFAKVDIYGVLYHLWHRINCFSNLTDCLFSIGYSLGESFSISWWEVGGVW